MSVACTDVYNHPHTHIFQVLCQLNGWRSMAGGRPGDTGAWSCVSVCLYIGSVLACVLLCVCVSVYLHLCWSMPDREQGLGQQSAWGFGMGCGVGDAQDSFFLILYSRRGEEAGVLFFLALSLTALSGY